MATPTQSDGLRVAGWGSYVESLTRITTTLLVLMYGLGFLILSAHEARYGIMQFSPLRTRIFLVGFAFVALVALPAAALHYKIAYYGPLKPVVENNDPAVQQWKEVFLAFGFAYTAFFIGAVFSFLFVAPRVKATPFHWWTLLVHLALFFGLLFAYSVTAKRFANHPRMMTAAAVLVTLLLFVYLQHNNEQLATVTVWLSMAGVAFRIFHFDSNRLQSALDFRNWLFAMIFVGFYISSVFELVQPKYGGGAPTPATVFLEKPIGWFDSTTVSVSLIDETDQGYYVLSSGKDKALFIPRKDVSSIYYGPVADLQKQK